jgi:signal transduction histidine kinase
MVDRRHHDRVCEQIVEAVDSHLRTAGSSLADEEDTIGEVRGQVRSIVAGTLSILSAEGKDAEEPLRPRAAIDASQSVGRSRARRSIHPSESLAAANVLFDLALPELTKFLDDSESVVEPLAVASALHHSIMAHVEPAAIGYVDALLDKLSAAQHEERLRVSRDLHDRVAHGIAAAIQRISLSRMALPQGGTRSSEMLTAAEHILEVALADTRSLALDLRQTVGDKHLDEAVRDYLDDVGPSNVALDVRSNGTSRQLAPGISDEAFLIIQEAIRNIIAHAEASTITITFWWDRDNVTVEVMDDGIGFDGTRIRSGALGRLTMQERTDVIGGELSIDARPAAGTIVRLEIPCKEITV